MRRFLILLCLLWAGAAGAEQPLDNAMLESRARHIMHDIRCVVCAGQSVADSEASLAGDMRQLIRDQIAAGRSEQEIRDFLRLRYGEGIFLRPALSGQTWFLWFCPVLVLLIGAMVIRLSFRSHKALSLTEDRDD